MGPVNQVRYLLKVAGTDRMLDLDHDFLVNDLFNALLNTELGAAPGNGLGVIETNPHFDFSRTFDLGNNRVFNIPSICQWSLIPFADGEDFPAESTPEQIVNTLHILRKFVAANMLSLYDNCFDEDGNPKAWLKEGIDKYLTKLERPIELAAAWNDQIFKRSIFDMLCLTLISYNKDRYLGEPSKGAYARVLMHVYTLLIKEFIANTDSFTRDKIEYTIGLKHILEIVKAYLSAKSESNLVRSEINVAKAAARKLILTGTIMALFPEHKEKGLNHFLEVIEGLSIDTSDEVIYQCIDHILICSESMSAILEPAIKLSPASIQGRMDPDIYPELYGSEALVASWLQKIEMLKSENLIVDAYKLELHVVNLVRLYRNAVKNDDMAIKNLLADQLRQANSMLVNCAWATSVIQKMQEWVRAMSIVGYDAPLASLVRTVYWQASELSEEKSYYYINQMIDKIIQNEISDDRIKQLQALLFDLAREKDDASTHLAVKLSIVRALPKPEVKPTEDPVNEVLMVPALDDELDVRVLSRQRAISLLESTKMPLLMKWRFQGDDFALKPSLRIYQDSHEVPRQYRYLQRFESYLNDTISENAEALAQCKMVFPLFWQVEAALEYQCNRLPGFIYGLAPLVNNAINLETVEGKIYFTAESVINGLVDRNDRVYRLETKITTTYEYVSPVWRLSSLSIEGLHKDFVNALLGINIDPISSDTIKAMASHDALAAYYFRPIMTKIETLDFYKEGKGAWLIPLAIGLDSDKVTEKQRIASLALVSRDINNLLRDIETDETLTSTESRCHVLKYLSEFILELSLMPLSLKTTITAIADDDHTSNMQKFLHALIVYLCTQNKQGLLKTLEPILIDMVRADGSATDKYIITSIIMLISSTCGFRSSVRELLDNLKNKVADDDVKTAAVRTLNALELLLGSHSESEMLSKLKLIITRRYEFAVSTTTTPAGARSSPGVVRTPSRDAFHVPSPAHRSVTTGNIPTAAHTPSPRLARMLSPGGATHQTVAAAGAGVDGRQPAPTT